MRARNIKPGFFQNEDLVELPPETRLLFIGLWLLADREGRLEDRPKKIKMQVFPSDDWSIDLLLTQLNDLNLIHRYEVESGQRYIEIPKFLEHQRPHHQEKQSVIPKYEGVRTKVRNSSNQGASQSALIPDTGYLNDESLSIGRVTSTEFEKWWAEYPKKVKKKTAREIWMRKKPDADILIADVQNRIANDRRWLEGFTPDPTTYLNQERWDDELETARPVSDPRVRTAKPL